MNAIGLLHTAKVGMPGEQDLQISTSRYSSLGSREIAGMHRKNKNMRWTAAMDFGSCGTNEIAQKLFGGPSIWK